VTGMLGCRGQTKDGFVRSLCFFFRDVCRLGINPDCNYAFLQLTCFSRLGFFWDDVFLWCRFVPKGLCHAVLTNLEPSVIRGTESTSLLKSIEDRVNQFHSSLHQSPVTKRSKVVTGVVCISNHAQREGRYFEAQGHGD